jgi:hypothetical protein
MEAMRRELVWIERPDFWGWVAPSAYGSSSGRSAHRRLDRQNEKSVRTAARQGVRISCLRRTPESQEPQTLSHSDGHSDSNVETECPPVTGVKVLIAMRRGEWGGLPRASLKNMASKRPENSLSVLRIQSIAERL